MKREERAMKSADFATRRRLFLGAGVVALATPAALAASNSAATPGDDRRALEARLAALEDTTAIRELHRAHAGRVGARHLEDMAIEVAPDRGMAMARSTCVVTVTSPIEAPGCTLVDMAVAQGEGVVRHDERRVLEQTFVRRDGTWHSESAELREPA
jgi:hypothetical protein